MDLAWGAGCDDVIQGLDILGVRGVDQRLEAKLVNGLTTVSQRGRYFTILPWAVGEYFDAERKLGSTAFDEDEFRSFLLRVEYLTLACTHLHETPGDGGAALGSVTFGKEMAALRAGESIAYPKGRRDSMLLIYFGPCRALGMMRLGDRDEPYVLTPRGQRIWKARNEALAGASVQALLEAENLSPDLVRAVDAHFSLQGLSLAPHEAELLREALTVPWVPGGASRSSSASWGAR